MRGKEIEMKGKNDSVQQETKQGGGEKRDIGKGEK